MAPVLFIWEQDGSGLSRSNASLPTPLLHLPLTSTIEGDYSVLVKCE